MASESPLNDLVQERAPIKIDIYTTRFCPYCIRAKGLLDRKRVTYNEYLLDDDDFQREVMIRRSNGRTSVPQIFIGGRGIGGCDELHVLDSVGELDVMLGLVD